MTLGIYGSNGTGRELHGMIQMMGNNEWERIVFIDDTKEEGETYGCPRMPYAVFADRYTPNDTKIIIAVGEPKAREFLYNRVKAQKYTLATIVHPSSIVSPNVALGEGCVIRTNCIISDNVKIEDNVYIQSKAIIGHDVVVHKHSVISNFCQVAGNSSVGEKVFMGVHSCVREKTVIGNNVTIAMMSAVMKDVPENATVIGNPARVFRIDENHSVFGSRGKAVLKK